MSGGKLTLSAVFLPVALCSSQAQAPAGAAEGVVADTGGVSAAAGGLALVVPAVIYNGWHFEMRIEGGTPGDVVRVYASDAPPVAGTVVCPADAGGACHGLSGAVAVGDAVFDDSGTARVMIFTDYLEAVPRWYQALVVRGAPEASPILRTDPRSYRIDTDGDRARDYIEEWLGTDPLRRDTDGDGIPDGADVEPLLPGPFDTFVPDDRYATDPHVIVGDPEFEEGTGRIVFSTATGSELWTARLDLTTGDFVPRDGRGVLVATGIAPMNPSQNGPEWVRDANGGYVLFAVENPNVPEDYWVAYGWENPDGTWGTRLLPGGGKVSRGLAPLGQQDLTQQRKRLVLFRRNAWGGGQAYAREVEDPSTFVRVNQQVFNYDLRYTSSGYGDWLMGTAPRGPLSPYGQAYEQVFVHDPHRNVTVWISDDPTHKFEGYVWRDPRSGRHMALAARGEVFFGRTDIAVWRERGDRTFELVKVIKPPPSHPFVLQPRAFTYDGRSYVTFVASKRRRARDRGVAQIWLASVDEDTPLLRRIDEGNTFAKLDPEVVTYGARPWVYYTQSGRDPVTGQVTRVIRRCELGLPPPSGAAAAGGAAGGAILGTEDP